MSQTTSSPLSLPFIQKIQACLAGKTSALLYLLVMLLVIGLSLAPIFPWQVTPASAPPEMFSGERAMAHLPVIAQEAHPSGSPAQARVRDYLVQQLTDLGLEVEVQQAAGAENVVARLHGTNPSGAILVQAHYDSYRGPGAGDNGSGVAVLLEIMRALAAGPVPRNDIIALFDDSEELPDAFTGTKAFIRSHPWMADVRVAIGMDTAARGFICVDDTGSSNGWMVQALARAYTGGAWSSVSGGGNYDTAPFRQAGIQILELEDNYPFHEQHTAEDVPELVNPGSVQQLGKQALAVVRELSDADLSNTSGEQETFQYLPFYVGLMHYPEAWALPLAILAGVLLIVALGLALWCKAASWRGLAVAALAILMMAGLAAVAVNAFWQAAPDLFHWETSGWPEWPEAIPPGGWWIWIVSNALAVVLAVMGYRLVRRWSQPANFAFFGLFIFAVLAVLLGISTPRAAILPTWPVLGGAAFWIAAVLARRARPGSLASGFVLLAAIPSLVSILPLLPVVFMSDGTKSVAIIAGVWVILMGVILPVVDGLVARPADRVKEV